MAKKKENEVVDLVGSYMADVVKRGNGSKVYLSGDHAENTWGLPIPYLAFAWLIGSKAVLPMQRYLGVSGLRSSFKSTLMYEIGSWMIEYGMDLGYTPGAHFMYDTENKTSPDMMLAMCRGRVGPEVLSDEERARREELRDLRLDGIVDDDAETEDYADDLHNNIYFARRPFATPDSIEEWQEEVLSVLNKAKAIGVQPVGKRTGAFITIDSLMGKATEEEQAAVAKEGHATGRSFPVANAMVTRFLDSISLTGAPVMLGYVQHMKEDIGAQGHGTQYREKGATAAGFAATIHLRVKKIGKISKVTHPARWVDGPKVEGHTIRLTTHKSCVGPDGRSLDVDVVWQYIDEILPNGVEVSRQYMRYDWYGALGNLLVGMKYGDKKEASYDIERINRLIPFTMNGKLVNCPLLDLKDADVSAFGRAIEENPTVRKRVANLLRISGAKSFQEADIAEDKTQNTKVTRTKKSGNKTVVAVVDTATGEEVSAEEVVDG